MKKFLKYFFFAYMFISVAIIAQGDENSNVQLLGAMTFGISFLGWICIVTDKGSRRVKI